MPPAAETAPTSSGLLHGYIAPQMSGTRMRACLVSSVSTPEQPVHRGLRDDVATLVANVRVHVIARITIDGGKGAAAFRGQRSARLLDVCHGDGGHDAARPRRQ